jgi:hypothetical protein
MSNAIFDFPLQYARAVVGAPVFASLRKVGIITAVIGLEPHNLASAKAAGRPVSVSWVPLEIVVTRANGSTECLMSSEVGDYDLYLVREESQQRERIARRGKLNVQLPINRP